MTLLKKRGCAGCQPAGEPLADEGKASPDPLFFPKRHASYAGILIAFIAVTFVAGEHIDFGFLDAAKDFPGGFVWFVEQFMPNAKAFDQMGKIASALAMTILDAIAAGTLAAVIAFILAVIASRVSGGRRPCPDGHPRVCDGAPQYPDCRVGLHPSLLLQAGGIHRLSGAVLQKPRFPDACLHRDDRRGGCRVDRGAQGNGASKLQIIVHGVFPLSLTQVVSWVLYMIETNFRDATLVGMLTGTGIGFVFNWYYRTFKYPTAGTVIICIAVAVIVVEAVSNYVRRRIGAPDGHSGEMRASHGKIKVRVRTTSGTVLAVLVAFLAIATTYTMVNMGYGSADTIQAASDPVEYFKLMFLSPYLSNYTWADMFEGLAVTLCIAVLATAGGALIALVLSLLAASNLSNKFVSNIIKTVMAIIRSVPTIIWVLVFTVAIGLGSEAAVIGMMFHTVSFLTKAFSEAFEEVDQGSLEALKATGATWWQQIARGVFPDKLNEILSWIFIRFENNFVGAVTVGAIANSGGIGYYLYIVANYMFNWHEMGTIIYLCLAVSVTLEIIATQLRKRFIVHR